MKRVRLRDLTELRAAALALAAYATNDGKGRDVGDLVHEEVTEGRRAANEWRRLRGSPEVPYSSCGDLVHWLLRCLGCRDERIVNRSDDGGNHPWAVGVNISRLANSGLVHHQVADGGARPIPGDPLFLANVHGGHVCVLRWWDENGEGAITDDYGQPYARRRPRRLTRKNGIFHLDDCPLVWWLPLARVPLTETAIVPDDFERGEPDDNPYPEPGVDP